MSLDFCDSFQHYPDSIRLEKWSARGGAAGTAYARITGSYGMNCSTFSNKVLSTVLLAPVRQVWAGVAYKWTAFSTNTPAFDEILYFSESSDVNARIVSVTLEPDFRIAIRNTYANTLLATSSVSINDGTWNHFQAWCRLTPGPSDAADIIDCEVKLNSVTVVSFSGISAIPGTILEGFTNYVGFGPDGLGFDYGVQIADPWIHLSGFIGDVKVVPLWPNADGFHQDWVPDPAAANHYVNVDETHPITGDFLKSNVVGADELEGFEDISNMATGTCKGIQMLTYGLRSNAVVRHLLRTGGADFEFDAWNDLNYNRDCETFNPGTSLPFTQAEINALQYGAIIKS